MPSIYKRAGEELRMLGKTKQSITMFKRAFLVYKSKDDYHGQAHAVSYSHICVMCMGNKKVDNIL
jgi:hypothetical protein